MAGKRHRSEEIVLNLHQADVRFGKGMVRLDVIRQFSVREQSYYRWRKKNGGMGTGQLKESEKLQIENEQLY